TAVDNFTGTGTVSLAAGSWTDAALNIGGAGPDSVAIDRQNPTLAVNILDGALSDGDSSSVVTFTFSEAPGASFTEADIQVSAGLTLNAGSLSMIDATHYQATVTAVDNFTGTGTVSLAAGSWTDAALNIGGAGSGRVAIDRHNPTLPVNILHGALNGARRAQSLFSMARGATGTAARLSPSPSRRRRGQASPKPTSRSRPALRLMPAPCRCFAPPTTHAPSPPVSTFTSP